NHKSDRRLPKNPLMTSPPDLPAQNAVVRWCCGVPKQGLTVGGSFGVVPRSQSAGECVKWSKRRHGVAVILLRQQRQVRLRQPRIRFRIFGFESNLAQLSQM